MPPARLPTDEELVALLRALDGTLLEERSDEELVDSFTDEPDLRAALVRGWDAARAAADETARRLYDF